MKAFLGFMDHSPSEQLVGDPDTWHTTGVVLAEGGKCRLLADRLAERVNRRDRRLKKWSSAATAYRRTFLAGLAAALPGSGVSILATSAREAVIVANRERIIAELELTGRVAEKPGPRRVTRIRIGPFRRPSGGHYSFELPSNRALMIFWIAHFIARAHRDMAARLLSLTPPVRGLDWFLYVDKFAGDSPAKSPGAALFQALVQHNLRGGNLRTSFFHASAKTPEDLLADNIAGLVNQEARRRAPSPEFRAVLSTRQVYWEAG